MKTLFLDIETAPHKGYFWHMWKVDIPINMLLEPGYILCWAAKWAGDDGVMWVHERVGVYAMLRCMADLLDDADVVVHYFGSGFDIPWLNGQFVKYDIDPPSPYQQIDLKHLVKRQFYLPSHKLDYVAQYFGVGQKVKHEGFELWTKCMAGDVGAWERMAEYNKGDVVVLEALYQKLLPWIPFHPHAGKSDTLSCPSCGSVDIREDGVYRARTLVYPRYLCEQCGAWSRGVKALPERHETTGVKL